MNFPPNLSYTNTTKLTWINPPLKTIQSVFNFTLYPYSQKKKNNTYNNPVYLAHKINFEAQFGCSRCFVKVVKMINNIGLWDARLVW